MYRFPIHRPFRVTSKYGSRWGSFHNGIDIAVPVGTAIHAPQRGTIISSFYNDKGGNQVIIEHPGGVKTGYAHLSARSPAGTRVKKNEIFAYSGNTGHSTGPHLHLTTKKRAELVDPLSLSWQNPSGQNLTPDIRIKGYSSQVITGVLLITGATIAGYFLLKNRL
jgi:murein DD-endopeptidase MepM/ murein hydrolase activator NlpD